MSEQSSVTIVAPLPRDKVDHVREKIAEQLGNPASNPIRAAIAPADETAFVHFASLHAIESSDGTSGFLVLEFSADGSSEEATRLFADRLGGRLAPILKFASTWRDGDVGEFLLRHRLAIGHRLGDTPGLAFCGTPGKTVPDILAEDRLASTVGKLLEAQETRVSPLGRLNEVRRSLRERKDSDWALEPPPPPIPAPAEEPSTITKVRKLALPFLTTFTWPLVLVLLPFSVWLLWPQSWLWEVRDPMHAWDWVRAGIEVAWLVLKVVVLTLAGLLLILLAAYVLFRRTEDRDWISERAPRAAVLDEIFARENPPGHVQNHMVSHTVLKPGSLRKLTIRLVFWAIARLSTLNPRPGHLGEIGTIHFARWINVPGTHDLLFFSNYGGSWESYLEDFITKAHAGLTGVWSNTAGFPRTRNLFQDGATDGERFKRFARDSMLPTPFWYCAYPELTTANIRTNALVRRGLACAMSEDEAVRWLALFGSAPRPLDKLETTQIQSLVFGGLGFKPHGILLALALSDEVDANRVWLSEVKPWIAFNDGRYLRDPAVLTFAASASGLTKLGLPDQGLATFPAVFISGMCGPGRDRILGDLGTNAPANWRWGKDGTDVVLLVYGDSPGAASGLRDRIEATCKQHGARISYEVPLTEVGESVSDRIEPFGFVDGVSQPAIRGTYRGLRNDDPIHMVEPGEFVLGYPDNRRSIPPAPMLGAEHDPELRLPIAGRDHGFAQTIAENPRLIGHNGSFLVVRQLEQDVETFEQYCVEQIGKIAPYVADLPVPLDDQDLTEYVGAKLIGRWKDGSSLVRFPYISASRLKELRGKAGIDVSRPETKPANAEASPIKPAGDGNSSGETKRETIQPDNDFLFGTEDPQGLRCPYGAHIRRANPRDSMEPGSDEQIGIVNRHRIIRVGRGYQEGSNKLAGLMFMCLAGDIERQFEFIQQTWMGSTKFHGLDVETDPIVSDAQEGRCGFTVPTRAGPIALASMPQFVTMRGGGYFFLPGKQLLDWLARA